MDAVALLTISGAFAVVAVSPGPANLGCALVAMRSGRAAGVRFGFGLFVGLAVWGAVAASGMGAILQASQWALLSLKIVGAGYLLYIAYRSARSAVRASEDHDLKLSHGCWFRQGFLLNVSNPKAVIAWMAALAMGLDGRAGLDALIVATVLCGAIGLINYMGWALVFSTPPVMRGYKQARRWIEGMMAGLFAVAGLGLLRSAVTR